MRFLASLFLTHCIFLNANSYAKSDLNAYKIEDLRVLFVEKNYPEYFAHALDINPSQRQGEWKKMTEEMGLGFLDEIVKSAKLNPENAQWVSKLSAWPIFKNDEFFREKRDNFFLSQIRSCKSDIRVSDCLNLAKDFFHNYSHGLEFHSKFIELLEPLTPNKLELWPYAKLIASSEYGEFYCHRNHIKRIIYQKMLVTEGLNIHPDCLKKLKPYLTKLSFEVDGESMRLHFILLKKLNLMGELEKTYLNVFYFLEGKHVELETLKKISKDFVLREKLLSLFQKKDLLPDTIFNEPNPKKRKSLVRIINRYFPEYLNNYAKTCLAYLSGEKYSLTGNPTPQCHQFFKLNASERLISQHFERTYHKYTAFMRQ